MDTKEKLEKFLKEFDHIVDSDRLDELFEELHISEVPLVAAEGFVEELRDSFEKLAKRFIEDNG